MTKIKIPIMCGETTCCNYNPVMFGICHLLKQTKNKRLCLAFNKELSMFDGRVLRCYECVKAAKEAIRLEREGE